VDLRNEPHLLAGQARTGSCWTGDTMSGGCPATDMAQNWPAAAGRAGKAILAVNSNLLIAVEGTDCYSGDCGWQGANLEGAAKYPVTLPVANRLVYSAHDYGPDLDKQAWFNAQTTAATLTATWTRYWAYLSLDEIAPVWLGELGTTNNSADVESNVAGSQGQWFSALTAFLRNQPEIQWTYWAINGEDTFGLLDPGYDALPPSSLKQQLLASAQFHLTLTGGVPACAATSAAPAGTSVSATSPSSIGVTWKAPAAISNCPVTYEVFRSATSGFTPAQSNMVGSGLTSPSFSDSGLSAATTYYYRIAAVDGHGTSTPSAQVSAKTLAAPVPSCHVAYTIASQWSGGYQAGITIQNTGKVSLSSWTLVWTLPPNETLTSFWNGVESQSGSTVTVKNETYNGSIAPGSSVTGIGLTVSGTKAAPSAFTLNGVPCK
jgi:endoglucanase